MKITCRIGHVTEQTTRFESFNNFRKKLINLHFEVFPADKDISANPIQST